MARHLYASLTGRASPFEVAQLMIVLNAASVTWESWWYPGFPELFHMLAFAFWWVLAVAFVAVPVIAFVWLFWAAIFDDTTGRAKK